MTKLRIGHGYDVHRLAAGRSLILGGVAIPYDRGLDGHSDADVLVLVSDGADPQLLSRRRTVGEVLDSLGATEAPRIDALPQPQSQGKIDLGAIAGGSDTYLGKGKAGTLDAKLSRLTKWVAAAFVLLTLFVALLGSL